MYRYIGNKAKLTPYILDKVQQMIGDTGTVADIMAGTGTVSLELRKKGYKVVASDVMTYSYHHLNVNLCMKKPPEFLGLKDIITDDSQCMYESVLKYLNCIEPKKSFFYREFSPEGTPRNGTPSRKYFTSENAMRIDAIREKINEWIDDKLINKSEESLLKHTLIMAVNEVANISGTYDIGLEEIFRGERRGVIDTEPFRLQFIDNKECPFGDYSIMGIEEDRITSGCNVLLYGVPGSGKSWTIEHEYCKKETNVERLVFHPDYTYSDFIGQILPNVDDDGQVSYKFTSGPFTNILADAYRNPEKEYILIIEEINRGNAPAIFGEVFQLLDRKTEIRDFDDDGYPVGTSEYGITNANIAKIVYGDPKHKVRIPSNLSILGTMNTSDQNVFTLDTAFQRRWEMRLIENNFEHVDRNLADAVILDTGITWEVFCTQINNIIVGNNARMTSAEDKRLGAYFVHLRDLRYDQEMGNLSDGEYDNLRRKEEDKSITEAEKERLDTIRNAMKQNRKFPEKVIKYLWDDAFKFNREVVFETSQFQSLEQVIRTFMYAEKMDRFVMFKENVRAAFTNPEE